MNKDAPSSVRVAEVPSVQWDQEMLARFKKVYKANVKRKIGSFTFDNVEYLTDYAKYLIEYLEVMLGVQPD